VQLIDIRTEVFACGFDPVLFGATRVNMYINNAYLTLVRRVNYYVDENTQDYNSVSGTSVYPLPTDFARTRSLRRTDIAVEMQMVGLRTIDRSIITSGAPYAYALDGSNVHLYPTPDQVYPFELRYWKMPAPLVNDTDVPTIPADYHNLLVYGATSECYAAEDDGPNMGAYWQAKYDKGLAMFAADMKFPSDDSPNQLADMWRGPPSLNQRGWSIYGSTWE
jgi:hypothetical protein